MKLSLKEIAFLAKSFQTVTPISLFANIDEECDGSEGKSLAENGIYKDAAFISPAKEIFDVVAGATRCTRFVLNDNVFLVEKTSYRSNDMLALAENVNGELELNLVDNLGDAMVQVSEFTGVSPLKNADISIELPPDQMLTLLAMVDIYRKKSLLAYVGQENASQSITIVEIAEQLSAPSPNSLVGMLKNNYNYSIPETENNQKILDKLIEKNIAAYHNGYLFSEEYAFFANNFLIPETAIILEALNILKDGEIAATTALCVCAGIRDIVMFSFGTDQIELSSLSGIQLLEIIEDFLKCPEISPSEKTDDQTYVAEPSKPITQNAEILNNNFCLNCGAPVNPNAKFCKGCGAKL